MKSFLFSYFLTPFLLLCSHTILQTIVADEMVDSASLNNESPSRAPRRSRSSKQSDLKNTLDNFIKCDVDLSDIDNGKSGTEYDKILEEEENRNNDDLVSLSEPSSTWYDMPLPPWGYPEQRFIELKQIVNKSNLSDLYPEGSCLTRKSKPAISRRLLTKYGLSSSGVTCSTPSKKVPYILPSLMPRWEVSTEITLPSTMRPVLTRCERK